MSLPVRTRVAVWAGALAGGVSRRLGRGAGATLPGAVTLKLAPNALADLARGRRSAIVTGTNGKTTTSAFLTAALTDPDEPGGVIANTTGANMATGLVAALGGTRSRAAVLETDELHVPGVMRSVRPRVLVLLNLSRDQLDRTHEVRRAADLWQEAIRAQTDLTVVANAADPNIAYAVLDGAGEHTTVVWVDGGLRWYGDAELCPRCGALLDVDDAGRWSSACGIEQPDADFRVEPASEGHDDARLVLPDGEVITLAPSLPGAANLSNAAFAVAAAAQMHVAPALAASRLTTVGEVAGRYGSLPLGRGTTRRPARMLLAKNPAGWTEALNLLEPDAVVALGVNARTQDGTDTSWLWDVPFEHLAGRTVGVFGERAADLELRLVHAGVGTVRAPGEGNVRDAHALADVLPEGDLTVLATYTTFQEVRRGA